MSERKLQYRRLDTGEIVGGEADVTGRSERNVEKIMLGMMRNMHEDLYVHDTATNSTRERGARDERENH